MSQPAKPFNERSFIVVDDGAPLTWEEFLQWNPDLENAQIEKIERALASLGVITITSGDTAQTIRVWEGGAK